MEDLSTNQLPKRKSLNLYYFLLIIFILITLSISAFGYYKYISNPCNHTTFYDIGTIDSRFNISQNDLREIIESATSVWNNAKNDKLFEYKMGADFKINLVYDSRQEESIQRQETLSQIESSKKGYDALKQQYDSLSSTYEQKLKKYEQEVAYFNSIGGAPQSEFDRLKQEQTQLNAMVKQINTLATSLNQLSKDLNLNIAEINTTAGKTFEKGLFKYNQIDIFEFQSRQELFITLVHEFGHALNMNHIDDPSAIMYYMVTESNNSEQVPTKSDLDELNRACKVNYWSIGI